MSAYYIIAMLTVILVNWMVPKKNKGIGEFIGLLMVGFFWPIVAILILAGIAFKGPKQVLKNIQDNRAKALEKK